MDLGMVTQAEILNSGDSPGGDLIASSLSMRKWGVRYSSLVVGDGNLE